MSICKTLSAACLCVCFASPVFAQPTPEQIEFFEKKIRPVLAEQCYKCHSSEAKKLKGKLLLDTQVGLLKGGEGGPIIVRGEPDKSRLIEALRYTNVEFQMPPRGKLSDAVIADFSAWVKMGAPWGKDTAVKDGGDKYKFDLAKRKQEHWAWRLLNHPDVPAVQNQDWKRSDIDAFILNQLEDKGLSPAADADPRTLARRLHFDIIGLPPTPQELDAFLRDNGGDKGLNPKAVEKLVDRLLASPHFGERWGRHWLDLVRYAESRGHEFDYNLPNAYQYRDYVIRALNQDVPYNQFVTEHLAGDLMPKPRMHPTENFNESILGTGFWFLGEQVHSPVDICQDRADRHDNMLDVMSKTFLGLTVSCARCHDHKFDAISTKDYYALAGYLQSSSYRLAAFDALEHNREVARQLSELDKKLEQKILKRKADAQFGDHSGRMHHYLIGAREVLLKQATADEIVARKTEEFKRHKFDAELLDRWIAYLPRAARDPQDPFHVWGKLCLSTDESLITKMKPQSDAWAIRNDKRNRGWLGADMMVVDYTRPNPEAWMQDGIVFGTGVNRAGSVKVAMKDGRPIVRFQVDSAACADPNLDRMRPAPGSENESGSLGGMSRSGRTLRTPTFTVKTGKVHYLVRGTGSIYASVEGHMMIAGPLHGGVVLPVKAGPEFRWISHDLSRYTGLRAHVEFTPAPGADFAVAMVVQGDVLPDPLGQTDDVFRGLFSVPKLTPEHVAVHHAVMISDTVGRLHDFVINFADSRDAPEAARLANWVMEHLDLLVADPKPILARLTESIEPLLAERAALLDSIKKTSRVAPALLDGDRVDEKIFIRGSYKTPGAVAPRRLLEALVNDDGWAGEYGIERYRRPDSGSGRLHLAQQMTDPRITPFVPRVMVNRIWHHLFGRGIVASVDNFGVLGEPRTHPELLDYLANQFIKDGWSVKRLIRRVVLSRTYQMSSRPDDKAKQLDPNNLLLSHMRIRRLEGEAIRDAILQVSGTIDRKMYGPSVPVYLTAFLEGRGRPASGPLDGNGRRSIYLAVRRNFLSPFLLAFDTPSPFSTVGRRTVSNVPAQALILLNDPFVQQQAGKWANRVVAEEKAAHARITALYLAAYSRPPSAAELAACSEFVEQQARLGQAAEAAVWADLTHVLFNAKEFIYLN